ncbi:uroporphyrin-III C-methyltransferase / precorrin-2 dehydrogenase / sirohydrochlorin ferrochelatase/uroporphyrin-III C-methyltransferase [Allopseudospirillum japonicum]|uniref:uroporphyrinogen-III C-methyltransferase n=1 Tax=Allopseudospirillum japonicum TaxID=64971 RepID=A0A1H6SUT7_9GAMM|nr:uroporphyrinogen-III C-methyltransferase [Allopseudospirillum japonicum]SEI71708.1 uroporphyrin-III C-methyltransferase / precorrin-2 dehydrogenase / sirohydrochlorin ferrochelatase/uroporphyrin-III C-methyltransferase [Allopseudospirillum japonicum]
MSFTKLTFSPSSPQAGKVYLIGAGPGDPDLITVKGLKLLQQADIVLYDRLVAPELLQEAPAHAKKFYVGKARSQHSVPQAEINEFLVKFARQGLRVVRLKGGDSFIFGRGGEELERLAQAGISFEVVPGVTAASGCATYAGIPLTHRDHAQSVRFVTGHLKEGHCNLPWQQLAQEKQTLVFYMGLGALPHISRELVHAGLPANTPIALIEQGTTRQQQTLIATLETIVAAVEARPQPICPPTLIIVGNVVHLAHKLAWFDPQHAQGTGFSEGKHPSSNLSIAQGA